MRAPAPLLRVMPRPLSEMGNATSADCEWKSTIADQGARTCRVAVHRIVLWARTEPREVTDALCRWFCNSGPERQNRSLQVAGAESRRNLDAIWRARLCRMHRR